MHRETALDLSAMSVKDQEMMGLPGPEAHVSNIEKAGTAYLEAQATRLNEQFGTSDNKQGWLQATMERSRTLIQAGGMAAVNLMQNPAVRMVTQAPPTTMAELTEDVTHWLLMAAPPLVGKLREVAGRIRAERLVSAERVVA